MTKPNAILLARLSDKREEDDLDLTDEGIPFALEDQIRRMHARCDELSWNPWKVIKNPRLSAYKKRKITLPDGRIEYRVFRPDLREALGYLWSGQATALLCLDLDRAFRDSKDLQDLIDVVDNAKHQIVVESCTGSLHMERGRDNFDAEIRVLVANKSSRDTARRVRAAREDRARRGKFGGGARPYGFDTDGLTRIETECKIIRDAGIAYLSGVSLRSLAKDLNTQGVSAPRSDQWKAETLSEIFKRPRNIARMESKAAREKATSNTEATWLDRLGVVATAPWDPIFSDDTYQAILAKLSKNCCRTSEGTVGRAVKYLLSGIARCWLCGDTMEVHRNGNRHPVYRCRTMVPRAERMQAPACADHYCGHWSCIQVRGCGTAPMEPLDAYVRELVIDRLSRPDALDLFAAPTAEVDTAALRAEVRTLSQRKNDLAEMFAAGLIDARQLATGSKDLQARIATAETTLMSALDVSPLAPLLGVDDVTTAYDDLALGTRRAVIETLYSVTVMSPAIARPRGPKAAGRPTTFDPSSVRVGPPVSVG